MSNNDRWTIWLRFTSCKIFVECLKRADAAGQLNAEGVTNALQSLKDLETGGLTPPLTIKDTGFPLPVSCNRIRQREHLNRYQNGFSSIRRSANGWHIRHIAEGVSMNAKTYRAMLVTESADGKFTRQIVQRSIDELPPGDVLIRVKYSSLNYKDALSTIGNRGVTKKYPHTPGVDAAGVVEQSSVSDLRPDDEVIVTASTWGWTHLAASANTSECPRIGL